MSELEAAGAGAPGAGGGVDDPAEAGVAEASLLDAPEDSVDDAGAAPESLLLSPLEAAGLALP